MLAICNRASARLVGALVAALLVLTCGLIAAPASASAAQATGASSISGTVTTSGGVLAAGARVTVEREWGTSWKDLDLEVSVGADGTYRIEGLEAGAYRLFFGGLKGHISEYWDDQWFPDDATIITLSEAEDVVGIDAALTATGSVSGAVADEDGVPITSGRVELYKRSESSGEWAIWAWSGDQGRLDATGSYSFAGLIPGVYTLRAESYSSANHAVEWWNDKPDSASADTFTIEAGSRLTGMDMRLADGASLSGTVLAADGAPATYASVTLYRRTGGSDDAPVWVWETGVNADVAGAYSLGGLQPGEYTLFFAQGNSLGMLEAWWGDASDVAGAHAIVVDAGRDITGLDVRLPPGASISGIVTGPDGAPVAESDVVLYERYGESGWLHGDRTATDSEGRYMFTAVPAGTYTVEFEPSAGSILLGEWWDDQRDEVHATPIVVDSHAVRTGVDARLSEGAAVEGTLTDHVGAQASATIYMYRKDVSDSGAVTWSWAAQTVTDDSGNYRLPSVEAGTYTLRFDPDSVELLPEWWSDAQTRDDAEVFALRTGELRTEMDAALALGAVISGTVTTTDGSPDQTRPQVRLYRWKTTPGEPSAWVLHSFMPQTPYRTGQYAFRGLEAGRYTLVFISPRDSSIRHWWRDSPDIEHADSIVVEAGDVVSDADARISAGPVAGSVPLVSGPAVVDSTLTVDPGVWTPGTGFAYQWFADGERVEGATSSSLVLSASEVGRRMSVVVTGSRIDYESVSLSSLDSAPVEAAHLSAVTPTIVGTAIVGSTLTAAPGEWEAGAALTYRWLADGVAIPGAESADLEIRPAVVGKRLTVTISGSKAGYESRALTSAATAPVAPGSLVTATPTISGAIAVGSTLTAVPGAWQAGAQRTYQWLANGAVVVGATSPTLVLAAAHKDKQISVQVTGKLAGYTTATKSSAVTAKVATAGTPVVTGSARVGGVLTATPGTWTVSTTFAYQWYASGSAIAGATKPTFVLTTAQDSKAITVRVTGSKSGYATVTKASAATLKVTRFSNPTISGGLGVGYALTAKPNTWSAGTGFTYQWYANGVAISGATKSTLILTSTQRDKQISVKVTGRQSGYTSVLTSSSSTARVATVSTPTITGVYMVGSTLTAKPNTWTTGTTFAYQWFADGVAISGATRSTLVLGSSQRDNQISVTVTGRKFGYGTIARGSAKSPRIALTAAPTIGGTLMVGSTLSAKPNTWTTGTTFTYQWYANGAAVSGATGSTFRPGKTYSGRTLMVRVVGSKSGYQTIARNTAVTSAVRSGKSAPATRDNCPSGWPIKGNQTTRYTVDWIFHVPGGQYYAVTDPEECFATETAALAWGYRKSLR